MFGHLAVKAEAGIDWLTVTVPRDAEGAHGWYHQLRSEHRSVLVSEMELEPRRINGYEGYAAGKLFLGERYDGYCAQATSATANAWFDRLYHPQQSIARLDAQVTVWYEHPLAVTWVSSQAERCEAANLRAPVTRRRTLTVYTNNKGGATLYLGAPSSDQRGRIYDKGAESGEEAYQAAYRYEVQLRDKLAEAWAAALRGSGSGRAAYLAGAVLTWFQTRGASCPDVGTLDVRIPRVSVGYETATQRRLRWLDEQVRPAVAKLLVTVPEADILAALGLKAGAETPPEHKGAEDGANG